MLAFGSITIGGCEGTGPGFRTTSIEITPSEVVLDAIGADTLLRARVIDDRGREVLGARIVWTADDSAIATVDDQGRVSALSQGSTVVRATASGLGFIEASAAAQVNVAPLATSLEVVGGGGQSGTVGQPLPLPIRVRATDRNAQPVVGQSLAFVVLDGGGSAEPIQAVTDEDGIATSIWTLGPTAGGLHQLSVEGPGGGVAVLAEALALAGPPAVVVVDAGGEQFGVRGRPLVDPIEVRVSDAFGNATGGVVVTFDVAAGAGEVDPATATTDLTGAVTTHWTLGPAAGTQVLQIGAPPASTLVQAYATEIPAGVGAASATTLTGTVAMPVSEPPSVLVVDSLGAPVPGVAVSFEVTAGGGEIEVGLPAPTSWARPPIAPVRAQVGRVAVGDDALETVSVGDDVGAVARSGAVQAAAVVHSDAEGRAAIATWRLGEVAGVANQILRATVEGLPSLVFTASALPASPATLQLVSGGDQTGAVTVALPQPIVVRVADAFDNPVGGTEVTFTPTSGFAHPPTTTTDAGGLASTMWTLGPTAGLHEVQAVAAGSVGPLVVGGTATGSAPSCPLSAPDSDFQIQLCWVGLADPTVAAALETAVARWESLVVGDLPDIVPNADHATCVAGAPWVSGPTLDDIVVYVAVEPIDGLGGALAGAAPCFVRDGGGLPSFARLRIDLDDVAPLAADETLDDVLVHEIAHALGFGTLWTTAGLLAEPSLGSAGPSPDTHFTGPRAIGAFDSAGGAARTVGAKVPVENRGGGGVADVHWRESVMGPELMTSELAPATPNPLSRVTAEAMADIGYIVAADQSDAYVVPFPNFPVVGPARVGAGSVSMGEDVWWGPIGVVDAAGRLVRVHRFQRRP